MELREIPIGAIFKFHPKSEEIISEAMARFDAYYGSLKRNPYRVLPDEQFEMAAFSLDPQDFGEFRSLHATRRGQPDVSIGLRQATQYGSLKAKAASLEVDIISSVPEGLREFQGNLPSRNGFMTSCDPEMFLEDGDGTLIPAFNALPHRSQCGLASNNIYYSDGFGAELVPTPRHCHVEVLGHLASTLIGMLQHVRAKFPNARLSAKTFLEVPKELMAAATNEQVSLGCKPSLNIYGTSGLTVDNAREFPYRMVGGHIHLGSKPMAKFLHAHAEPIIQAMDAFVGVPSVALFAGMEDPRRRQYYGRAGEYREQPHGLEYRTLSNAWMTHPMFAHLIFNMARGAFRFGFWNWRDVHGVDNGRVQYIIDSLDVEEARKFCKEYELILKYLLEKDSGYSWYMKALALIQKGVVASFPGWANVEQNWSLHTERTFEQGHYRLDLRSAEEIAQNTMNQTATGVLSSLGATTVPPWATRPGFTKSEVEAEVEVEDEEQVA